ncbi:hypothetical protein NDU88_000753 [Pleurodeles waltl]|uniref:Myb/SANT-like DNA-binding domain-containing protein n=1 Tax=Pleurodeles waltl TaxID=8319 RepID=A0AAV7WMA0_PLEWA|nr:hypothetical protein NDU88_000753 [Pleurodeles waltl]
MELSSRIVDRVNAVGQHPRTMDDIRKRWNGLREKAQAIRVTGRSAVRQGEDRPREPTLQKARSKILGAYQHSQDVLGQILANVQENRRLQEGQYQGISEDLQAINTTLVPTAEVLADMANIMRKAVLQQRATATSQTSELPSTSAAAS